MSNITSQLIRVGHSPDADDAFMFYALAQKKIPMRGFEVQHVIQDIESLNQRALCGDLEVTAVSCHAYAFLADRYSVMRSGASVGDNYGPILVAKANDNARQSGARIKIAVPGRLTTAYLVLQLYASTVGNCNLSGFKPVFMSFDRILDTVKRGKVDLGLLIHEGQITYADYGLKKVLDLGVWWHEKTGLPLPLGVDIIRRDLGKDTMKSFAGLFKESIEYALSHRREALKYALRFGRGISEKLNDRFVGMYVNNHTVDIGRDGEAGFRRLMGEAYQHGILSGKVKLEFI